jgi:steroid delta-isomerase-like uncharacterized protein
MAQGLIEQHFSALNARDMDGVLGAFNNDVEWVAPGGVILHGPAQVESFLLAWWQAFPDASYELGAHVVGETVAALEGILTATHKGTLHTPGGDIPATGRAVRVPYAAIIRLEGDQIKSKHLYFDLVQLLTELGVRGELVEA